MEEYVITNGCRYITMTDTGKAKKTTDIMQAKRFALESEAQEVINSRKKKCKGYHTRLLNGDGSIKKKKRKTYSSDVKRILYIHANGMCAICGKPLQLQEISLDHHIPLSRGGADNIENLEITHESCNRIKSNLLPEELTSELMDILMYQIEKKGCHKFRRNIAKLMLKEFC